MRWFLGQWSAMIRDLLMGVVSKIRKRDHLCKINDHLSRMKTNHLSKLNGFFDSTKKIIYFKKVIS